MPVVEVDIEVWCSCGEGLCHQVSQRRGRTGNIQVEPCEKCLEAAREDGADSRDAEVDGLEERIATLEETE